MKDTLGYTFLKDEITAGNVVMVNGEAFSRGTDQYNAEMKRREAPVVITEVIKPSTAKNYDTINWRKKTSIYETPVLRTISPSTTVVNSGRSIYETAPGTVEKFLNEQQAKQAAADQKLAELIFVPEPVLTLRQKVVIIIKGICALILLVITIGMIIFTVLLIATAICRIIRKALGWINGLSSRPF